MKIALILLAFLSILALYSIEAAPSSEASSGSSSSSGGGKSGSGNSSAGSGKSSSGGKTGGAGTTGGAGKTGGDKKTGGNKLGGKPDKTKPGRTGPVKPSPVKPSPVQTGPVKPSPVQTGPAKTGTPQKINAAGLSLITGYEKFVPNFYTTDGAGVKTIGYGHACQGGSCDGIKGPLTKEQATTLMQSDLAKVERVVNRLAPGIDQNKFAALVSFGFNEGVGALGTKDSGLARAVKAGDYKTAAKEFAKWNKVKDPKSKQLVPSKGLSRRRESERQMFCSSGGC